MEQVGRRRLLLGAAGGAGLAVAGVTGLALWPGAEAPLSQRPAPAQRVPVPLRVGDPARDAVATTEWVRSEARGRPVRLVVVSPPGTDRAALPVCVGLHGLGSNATWWSGPGMRRLLGAAWAARTPPFAMAALDGGDNYWHPFRRGDDPMRMLLEELPGWLTARGVGTSSGGGAALAAGVSMGGAGALLYARERIRRGDPLAATAALSPGLFTDWRIASRRPFAGETDWRAVDPLGFVPELAPTALGVWCGDRDPFVDATRRFMASARPEVATVSPGTHDGTYYATALPPLLRFLGAHTRAAPATVVGAARR